MSFCIKVKPSTNLWQLNQSRCLNADEAVLVGYFSHDELTRPQRSEKLSYTHQTETGPFRFQCFPIA